jgi:hypothetical protein
MPSPSHEDYRKSVLSWCRNHGREPDIAETLEQHAKAAAVLWHLDLEPARPILMRGYAHSPRGGDPWDPLVTLRCLLLAVLLGRAKINAWVRDLKASRLLCVLCGIDPDQRRPGVGTLYDFLHRLHNGPVRDCPCGHRLSPATMERRRAASPRPKNNKPKKRQTKAKKKARMRQRKKDPVTAPATAEPSATRKLVQQLRETEGQQNPQDLLARLAELLLETAVVRSAEQGLLGSLDQLVACGDGSPLPTGTRGHGKRACDCPATSRCDCHRIYQDPDAAIGYDSHRDRYFFGHHIYELTVCSQGHDLPMHLRLDPGNETDFTASLKALDHLRKQLRDHHPEMRIRTFVQDAGHDGEHNYRFALRHGIIPVIPLAKDAPGSHPQRPELSLSTRGVPLCQAGCEMAPWGSAGDDRRLFACPVKADTLDRCPMAPKDEPCWLCRPHAAMAPVVNLSIKQNPRLCPPVPRNAPRHERLCKLRSGAERSFSVKKAFFNLEAARHRRKSFWLIRLYLMAVLQHAKAWVADKDPKALVDHLLGRAQHDPDEQHDQAAA